MSDIEHVADHPIHDCTAPKPGVDPDVLLAHYHAGYLLMLGPDDSAFTGALGLAGDSTLAAEFAAPEESSSPGEPDYKPDPKLESPDKKGEQGVPSPDAPPAQVVRKLYAKLADGQMACHQIVGDPDTISDQVESWRQTLQAGVVATSSDVNPNPNAWTLLGGKALSVVARGWFSPLYYNGYWKWWKPTGRSEVTISLYRLNSKDAFDYFLVKMLWTVSPKNQRLDAGGIWFYNRDHKLHIQLSAQTANGSVNGELVNFEPKTVPTSQTYDIKFGGDLNAKVGTDPEAGGGVSAEIATKFTIPSVSTNATTAAPRVIWELQHDYGPGFGRGLGRNWPNTTISGTTAVTWALYRFSRTINDGRPPVMRITAQLTGNFGSDAEKFWLLKQILALPYESSQHVLQYHVPTMSYEPVHTAQNPIGIAPGKTATIHIKAHAPGLPLNWKPYGIPKDDKGREYLLVSPASGYLGDGKLQITAAHFAEPDTFGYLRVNSVPWTAADSLRKGGLDVPVKIIPG